MSEPQSIHGQWSSRLIFILVATGAAVGLGNIWMFPYFVGENGGAAFIFVYLLSVLAIGIPIMLAEIIIGRRVRKNPVDALRSIAEQSGAGRYWQGLGWLGVLIFFLVFSFYSVIAGWSLYYVVKGWSGAFNGLNAEGISVIWRGVITSPYQMLFWTSLFMSSTLWIISRGVTNGIERFVRILMPVLFVILLILVGYGTSTEGFRDAIIYLFHVDFSKITSGVVIAGMGMAFFSLNVGAGCMLVYGSYLSKETPLVNTVGTIIVLDIIVALLAGLAIFPIVFTYGLPLVSEGELMFHALPLAFADMGGGQLLSGAFFILLAFAAWTSAFSMVEPVVVTLMERGGLTRVQAVWFMGVSCWIISIACILSFNVWSDVKVIHDWNIFETITKLVTLLLLPLGGFLFAIFAGWFLKQSISIEELAISHQSKFYRFWLVACRFIAPLAVLIVFVSALVN